MSYLTEIFDRADIQQLREFLLHGVECMQPSSKPYEQRIDEARAPAIDMIKNRFPNMEEYEPLTAKVYDYASATQDVYMEIGMQCGAVIMLQLLTNTHFSHGNI